MSRLPSELDVVIVGTGMGGATLGYALAAAGRSVLFLERGRDPARGNAILGHTAEEFPGFHDATPEERREILARAGRRSFALKDAGRGEAFVPYIGEGAGGSSSLYGAALERLFPRDFDRWPVSYAEMTPWYRAAEDLFEVTGTADPLRREPDSSTVREPPQPLSEANAELFGHLSRRGLHPYRLHLAARQRPDCRLCQGYLCARGCKRDARTVCLYPALERPGVGLLTQTEVTDLETSGRKVTGVHAVQDGREVLFRGKLIVLAAGALATPLLLIRSGNLGNRSGLVGRRVMRHAIDLYVLCLAPRMRDPGEAKELGLTDFCLGDSEDLGSVQSFGRVPSPDYLANRPRQGVGRWLGPALLPLVRCFAHAPVIASIAEDSPSVENRLEWDKNGARLTYRLTQDDEARRRKLRAKVQQAFRGLGAVRAAVTGEREGLGHVCGTACMGDDPSTSVLDRFNRVHDLDNLYVVDGSWFPGSGCMNPSLTIAANALRVAHRLRSFF